MAKRPPARGPRRKQGGALAAERAVAFRWLWGALKEAEDGLEQLGLGRDSWRAVRIDLDALERRSARWVQTTQIVDEIDQRIGITRDVTPGRDLIALCNSRQRRDRARAKTARMLALQARAAHTALLLCERFEHVRRALRREAAAQAGRGARDTAAIQRIVEAGRHLVDTQGHSVLRAAGILVQRKDVQDDGQLAKGSPYTSAGIRELMREHGIRRRREKNSATNSRRK